MDRAYPRDPARGSCPEQSSATSTSEPTSRFSNILRIVRDEEEPSTACRRRAFVQVSDECRRDEYRGRWESPR